MTDQLSPQLSPSLDASPGVAETHISTVFFTGDRAYKILKPIQTSFLDFSTTDKRLVAVDEEIRLNRRMAPDVYLGSADVKEGEELVDRIIVMKRLPPDRRLSRLVSDPDLHDHLRRVVRTVAAFHAAEAPIVDAVDIAGRDAVTRNWQDNLRDMEPLVGGAFDRSEFDRVAHLALRYLDHSEALFNDRLANGFVRDGHGDLTADDIFCLADGPRILDCLGFDRALRVADVLCDVAFLAMDMDRLAGPSAADVVWRYYAEFSDEHHPESLAHHYVAYRSHVRAKVASMRHQQGDPDAATLARAHLHLSLRHLELARRRLVIVGGSPGSGKTTVARALSNDKQWSMICSDEIRKELTGRGHLERDFAQPGEGIYTEETSAQTYDEVFRRASLLLMSGESVILDASFSDPAHRDRARAMAEERGADLIEIECVLGIDLARERIERRLHAGNDPSDARPEILDALRSRHAVWPEADKLSTSGSFDATAEAALALVATR